MGLIAFNSTAIRLRHAYTRPNPKRRRKCLIVPDPPDKSEILRHSKRHGCWRCAKRVSQLPREIFSDRRFEPCRAKFCRDFKGKICPTGQSVRISRGPPCISSCCETTISLAGRVSKPSVQFEEFRLRFSLLRARSNSLAEHSAELRTNSLVASFVVRLRHAAGRCEIRRQAPSS